MGCPSGYIASNTSLGTLCLPTSVEGNTANATAQNSLAYMGYTGSQNAGVLTNFLNGLSSNNSSATNGMNSLLAGFSATPPTNSNNNGLVIVGVVVIIIVLIYFLLVK